MDVFITYNYFYGDSSIPPTHTNFNVVCFFLFFFGKTFFDIYFHATRVPAHSFGNQSVRLGFLHNSFLQPIRQGWLQLNNLIMEFFFFLSEWALLARYVYTYEEFVIVTKLHSATEWQRQDTDNKRTIYK